MNITIIGTGYVGLVTGACLADLGHSVVCFDSDARKISELTAGRIPIYEPGLTMLVARALQYGALHFTTNAAGAIQHGQAIFIAVGTPSDSDGSAYLGNIDAVATLIGQHMTAPTVVVNKSTVPVGTAERVRIKIEGEFDRRLASGGAVPSAWAVVSNPEFLKEGSAVCDFKQPDRVIVGLEDSTKDFAHEIMLNIYEPLCDNILFMSVRGAELTKYAANAMLATRISFMNELAKLSELAGVDIDEVRTGIGSDPRIGPHFLNAGVGYGGSCFPKDIQALRNTAASYGIELGVLRAVDETNSFQTHTYMLRCIERHFRSLPGKTIAVWGLAFKAGTDDVRESPALKLVVNLVRVGAFVQVCDPIASDNAFNYLKGQLNSEQMRQVRSCGTLDISLEEVDAVVIMTEAPEHRARFASTEPFPISTVFDGRNILDYQTMKKQSINYFSVGRPPILNA